MQRAESRARLKSLVVARPHAYAIVPTDGYESNRLMRADWVRTAESGDLSLWVEPGYPGALPLAPDPAGRWTLDSPDGHTFTGATWAPTESASPWDDWFVHIDADGDLDPLQCREGGPRVTCDGDALMVERTLSRDVVPLDALFAYLAACPDVEVDDLIARLRRAQHDFDASKAQVRR